MVLRYAHSHGERALPVAALVVMKHLVQRLTILLKKEKSFYLLAFALFVAWISIFDADNLIAHVRLLLEVRDLRRAKRFYAEEIKIIEQEQSRRSGDIKALEKFAREKYLMKRNGEDLYVIKKTKP